MREGGRCTHLRDDAAHCQLDDGNAGVMPVGTWSTLKCFGGSVWKAPSVAWPVCGQKAGRTNLTDTIADCRGKLGIHGVVPIGTGSTLDML